MPLDGAVISTEGKIYKYAWCWKSSGRNTLLSGGTGHCPSLSIHLQQKCLCRCPFIKTSLKTVNAHSCSYISSSSVPPLLSNWNSTSLTCTAFFKLVKVSFINNILYRRPKGAKCSFPARWSVQHPWILFVSGVVLQSAKHIKCSKDTTWKNCELSPSMSVGDKHVHYLTELCVFRCLRDSFFKSKLINA